MRSNDLNQSYYPQIQGGITARELDIITTCLRHEDTLARLSVYTANLTGDPERRQMLSSMARERLQLFDRCLTIMKQQTGFLH